MAKRVFDVSSLNDIACKFLVQRIIDIKPFGNGAINDTFKIATAEGSFFMQRINSDYFPEPEKLRSNFQMISSCLGSQLSLRPISSLDGNLWHLAEDGAYWRMFDFIEQSYSCSRIENIYQAYEIAKAFGSYMKLLSALPAGALFPVVDGFHDTPLRLQSLIAAAETDELNRLRDCRQELSFVHDCQAEIDKFSALLASGAIPERFAHNDTGIDNALLDIKTNAAVAVIDLDTTMAGNSLFDFGDMFRSALGVEFDERPSPLECFRSLLKGYLAGTGDLLTGAEISNFSLSGRIISLELGIRYLTDYLTGDKVFRYDNGASLLRARKSFLRYKIMKHYSGQFDEIVAMALLDYNR